MASECVLIHDATSSRRETCSGRSEPLGTPFVPRTLPLSVESHQIDEAVIRQQLADLPEEDVDVTVPRRRALAEEGHVRLIGLSESRVVRMVPVRERVVEADAQSE